jgi:hypothetical protein
LTQNVLASEFEFHLIITLISGELFLVYVVPSEDMWYIKRDSGFIAAHWQGFGQSSHYVNGRLRRSGC